MPDATAKLYRRVIDAVLRDIAMGLYPIGSKLPPERELANLNSVSRTTVREAMVALEMLGVVEMRKGSGIYIIGEPSGIGVQPDLDVGAFELIEARLVIEAEVAALAARHASAQHVDRLEQLVEGMRNPVEVEAEAFDREFHTVIAEATGNGAMVAVVTQLWDMRERAPLARTILHKARGLGLASRIDEHLAILDALRAHDSAGARDAMRTHLERVIEHLLVTTENADIAAAQERTATLRERLEPARS